MTDISKKSQNEMILDYLLTGSKITPLDALRDCGCLRLSARIFDLRERGINIQMDRDPIRHYATYWIDAEDIKLYANNNKED